MAVKDLNASYIIKDMIEAGIKSLKIEGRMRSPYYLATVLSSYRKIIDSYYDGTLNDEILKEENKILSRVSNRDNSTHFFMKDADITDQYYSGRWEVSNQDYLGFITNYDNETKLCTFSQRNYFSTSDIILIFTPEGRRIKYVVKELFNENMEKVEKANHAEEILHFYIDEDIPYGSMMRRYYE